ncbi:hypothetical protein B0J11DRAFT_602136 [Dendryphion nanum]|uniref:J domain-containing protein n=1 Tax=Dendryphion nanum TaxID=256645 RepID=A0A9P9CXP7_9PLEO|nr:hypothetical protein B0J11DRAFT_602136 [Dendryphion nanum]
MSSTDPSVDSLSASLASQWKPHPTKPRADDKPGTGKAVQNTGLLTPEGTPEVDDGRIEADKRQQAELKAAEAAKESPESQHPENKEPQSSTKTDDDGTNDEAAKQAAILREVLSCGHNEYHKILGIKEDYDSATEEMAAVERAVYSRGIEVHPKYNKDENAEKAWNMIRTAGDELGCREGVYQEVLDFGDENSDALDDDSGSEMDGLEMESPKPTKIVLGWYEEATPLMDQLQQNPKSFSVRKKLDAINDKIKKKNEEEEQNDTSMWLLDYKAISKFYQEVGPFVDRLRGNPNDQEALDGAKGVEKELNEYLNKNHYPGAWTFKQDLLMQEAVKEKTMEAKQMKNDIEEKRNRRMEERKREKAAEKGATGTEQPKKSSPAISIDWRPGLTTKGEEMYAMQPYERTSKVTQQKSMDQCFFLIEKKGKTKGGNSMVFEDAETIGPKATDGYLKQLPESERVDIRTEKYKHSTADKMGFVEIDDIAVKPGYSSRVYPAICIRVKYDTGMYKYPNRTVFRKIWGSARADRMIEDFYNDKGLTIPWEKRAKRPRAGGSVKVVESVEETTSARATERPRRGRTTSRSPERRRSSSVSSSASFLSDEGLERLGGIEDRMDKFEKMFENLSNKLDKLR